MNNILNNTYHQKLNIGINNNQNAYKINSNTSLSNNTIDQTNPTDTVELNEKDENIINTKKTYDAFKDSCSDFGYVQTLNGNSADMSLYYNTAIILMKEDGIPTASFIPDSQNSTSYLSFVDKVKDFAENLNATKPGFLPDCLTDFCDSYKDKLKQYGCNQKMDSYESIFYIS